MLPRAARCVYRMFCGFRFGLSAVSCCRFGSAPNYVVFRTATGPARMYVIGCTRGACVVCSKALRDGREDELDG